MKDLGRCALRAISTTVLACVSSFVLGCMGTVDTPASVPSDDAGAPPPAEGGAGCGDVATDAQNCGRCGHSCLGGLCDKGVCQPIVLAADQPGPQEVLVDATRAYWTNFGTTTTRASVASVS